MITGYALYYSPCKRALFNWHYVTQQCIHNALRERETTVPRPAQLRVPDFLPASPQADKQRGPGSKTKTPGLPEQTPESLQQSNQLAD